MEAFVDGAFAFALTLLAIAGDHIPASVAELLDAVKGVPAYALSFVVVTTMWAGHVEWSRSYGLDDAATRRLSLVLVFLVLVFVYPVKLVFSALFNGLSNGYLSPNFALHRYAEVPELFIVFGLAFGSLGAVVWLVYAHAWRKRDVIGLDAGERVMIHARLLSWGLIPIVAALSIILTLLIPARAESGNWIGVPGYIYFCLNIVTPQILRRARRRRDKLAAT